MFLESEVLSTHEPTMTAFISNEVNFILKKAIHV